MTTGLNMMILNFCVGCVLVFWFVKGKVQNTYFGSFTLDFWSIWPTSKTYVNKELLLFVSWPKNLCPRVTVMFHPCFLVDFWINKANVTFPILVILGLTLQENMQWLKDLPRVFGGKTWMRLRSRELPHYRYKIVIKQHSVHHMKSHVTRIVVGHKHVQ